VPNVSTTATKTSEPVATTPATISVVNQGQLQATQPATVSEALRYTPGVISEGFGISNRDQIYVRGFSENDGGVQYLDGLRLPFGNGFASPRQDPYLLDRIEVIKGPASILYGQASPGGIVNSISKRPLDQPFHEVILQGGNWNTANLGFDFGGPVNNNPDVSYRLAGILRNAEAQADFVRDFRQAIAPSISIKPTDDTKLTIYASYIHDNPGGRFYNLLPSQGTVTYNPNGQLPRSRSDADPNYNKFDQTQASVGYMLEHRFNNIFSFQQNTRYYHGEAELNDVFSIGYQPGSTTTVNRFTRLNTEKLDGVTNDNQLQAQFNTGFLRHTALVGMDYQYLKDASALGLAFSVPLNLYAPVYYQAITPPPILSNQMQRQGQLGGYAQDQIQVGNLHLLAGLRYDDALTDTTNLLTNAPAQRKSSSALTYRLGALYQFDNGFAPYVSYSTSFFPTTGYDFFGQPFKPTTGEQSEAGIKFQPNGYNALFTVSVFDLTKHNVLTADPDPTHGSSQVQIGAVRSTGVELSATARILDNWNLLASYTYDDVRVTEANVNLGTIGKHPVLIPENAASMLLDYTFRGGPAVGLTLGGGVRYIGTSYADDTNTVAVPSYTLMDLLARYDFGALSKQYAGWQAQLNMSNVFDRVYVAGCTNLTACYYGQGRTVLAGLRYRW
jgi:iron complex outermembrane recepter protein